MDKKWFQSKGVWIGIITALVGSLEVIRTAVIAGDFTTLGFLTIILGVLKVWERVTRTL